MRYLIKLSFVLLIVLCISGIGHALTFPQETRCILIDFYDFENSDRLYYRSSTSLETQNRLKALIVKAEDRVSKFYQNKKSTPKYIYCPTEEDYLNFGSPFSTPASANMKLGAYVVIGKAGADLDILAHEISHAELYERIGFFNRLLKIPIWFDEGLAMQVDYRSYYSNDTLKSKSNNYQNLPALTKISTGAQFWSGTKEEVMLNYMTSKYEVSKWYSQKKLNSFINSINEGDDFDEAFWIP